MERISRRRARFILGLFMLVLSVYSIKLFSLQLIQNNGSRNNQNP